MNRLAGETSPYLLQHAENPVDWFPWGDEALEKAETEDLPIFLSIGYAACHWCHVMERESFEDPETAAYLNEHFVPVKVDREERPDLDGIYMDAARSLTGQGGWPLSAFLTPDGRPFYAGTYFPKESAHGLPSFRQVLEAIAETWSHRREDVETQGRRVAEAVARTGLLAASTDPLNADLETEALAILRRAFDDRWGGFGGAPKFPQPMTLEFVLRMAVRGEPDALGILTTTLDRMAAGGIHDHVGGGFARYATDAAWHVPHFEKMLYDNAQLAQLYARTWRLTRDDRYRSIAASTLDYLLREMQQPEGGFSTSQDADAEGVEGRFSTWSWDELVALIGEEPARALGAVPEGNWEGTNVLWMPGGYLPVADEHRRRLFEAREARTRPATDDKVVTAWNAMAIQALSEAGRALHEPTYLDAAVRCAGFVFDHLRRGDGRLLRSWRAGRAGRPGFCDDHALLAAACLALHAATGDGRWFEEAHRLGAALVELFFDDERGGFFQTGRDDAALIVRPKELEDNAVPSGNSAAADVLQRLALLTGDRDLGTKGLSALRSVRDLLGRAPTGFGHALCALDLSLGPSREIAIVGEPSDPATERLVDEVLRERFLPNAVLAVAPAGVVPEGLGLLEARPQVDGLPTAYVCEGFACLLPVTQPDQLGDQLGALIA
jgi:uncharacterized protein YyaL (SSP411 family)